MAVAESISRYRWVVLIITFVAALSNGLAAQAVAPLAPIFQPELGLSKAEVGLFSSAAFAGAWGVLLVAGSLTDRLGARLMMSAGQLVTGALVLSMSLVGSFFQAAAVMLGAGIGRGIVAPSVTKAVVDWFPPSARATALGANQTAVPAAGILTASFLPALALALGWRGAIAVVGLAVIAGAVATALLYRDRPVVAETGTSGKGSSYSLKDAIRSREVLIMSGMGPLLAAVQFTPIAYLALYFNEVVLVSRIPEASTRIVAAGGYLALFHTGGIVGRVFWGVVSDRLFPGRRSSVLVIVSAASAVMSLVMGTIDPGYPLWLLSAIVFAYGLAAMGWRGPYLLMAAELAGPGRTATGVGLCMTSMQFGFVGAPPIFGFVLDVTGSYLPAWLFLASLSTAAVLMGMLALRRERRPSSPAA